MLTFIFDFRSYQDGVELDPYTLGRSEGVLSEYVETVSRRYAKRTPVAAAAVGTEAGQGGEVTGRAGTEVVSLDQTGLDKVKKEGGFVKFFAPWSVL